MSYPDSGLVADGADGDGGVVDEAPENENRAQVTFMVPFC